MIKMNLVSTTFAILLLFGSIAAKLENPINSVEVNNKHSLSAVQFISIETICQHRVILDFQIWYEAWSIKYIQENNGKSGTDLNSSMIGEVDEHLQQLKNYIAALETKKPAISLFAPLHMDVKVSKLNHDIHKLLHDPENGVNRFENSQLQEYLQKQHGHYTPHLINEINNTPFSNDLIASVAEAFESDWVIQNEPEGELMAEKVNELAGPLRATLRQIIKTFANTNDLIYKALDAPTKASLQLFFDKFMFLLTPEQIREDVLENLVGSDVPQEINQKFFDKDVFYKLNSPHTSFTDRINRDMFITLPNIESNLEKIHKAVKDQLFSWNFLIEFDSEASDLQLAVPKIERDETEKATTELRKRAKLGLMMYKVYLFARMDGTLPNGQHLNNQQILQNLFDWVKETEAFDSPKSEVDEFGIEFSPLPATRYAQLFNPSKFKKFYVPLLHYICNKIVGCKMMSPENKPKIIEQFEKYGNFEQLKANKELASLVPVEILDEINKSIEDNEITRLEKNLDNLLDQDMEDILDIPSDSEDEDVKEEPININRKKSEISFNPLKDDLQRIDSGIISPISSPLKISRQKSNVSDKPVLNEEVIPKAYQVKKRGPAKLMAQVSDKHVEAFKPIINKFLPSTGEINQKSKDFISKYLDKAEIAGKDKNKSIMRTLLINHVLNRYKADEDIMKKDDSIKINPTTAVIHMINEKMVAKLRGTYSFSGAAGLKNFFMKSISPISGMKYETSIKVEQKFFINDMILFVYFAQEDRLLRASKDAKKTKQEKLQIKNEVVNTNSILHGYLLNDQINKLEFNKIRPYVIRQIMQNPTLMEYMPAYEFFINFFDMFNYFENIEEQDKAETNGFSGVYMNFYSFLNTLRTEIKKDVENPHAYVLERLEHCLAHTEDIEELTAHSYDANCKMSHRKYAEMYYFYKLYLIANHKQVSVTLSAYPAAKFDTHSRIFLNFAREYPNTAFDEICKETPKESICVSFNFFRILLNYVQNEKLSTNYLVSEIKKVYDQHDPIQKFHFLAGIEALNLHLDRGNMKIWERLMLLTKELSKANMDFFNYKIEDIPALSNFLKRTYRKRSFSEDEARVAQAVQVILGGEQHPNFSEDSFGTYLVHGGIVYLDYVKIFLLLSSTTAEFDRIAKFIVDSKSGSSLIRMNDPHDNSVYDALLSKAGNKALKPEQRFSAIREFMVEKYEASREVCNNSIKRRIIVEEPLDEEGLDDYQSLFSNLDDESEANFDEEEENFEKISAELQSTPIKQQHEQVLLGQELFQFEIKRSVSSEFVDEFDDEEPLVVDVHYNQFNGEGSELQTNNAKMFIGGKEYALQEGQNLQNAINANVQKMAHQKGDVKNGDYIIGTEGGADLQKELLAVVIQNSQLEDKKISKKSKKNRKLI